MQALANGPDATLWGQLLNSGIMLAVGGAVITIFFRFKDKITDQVNEDKLAAARAVLEAKQELDEKLDDLTRAVEVVRNELLGMDGKSGLISEIGVSRERRHRMANMLTTLSGQTSIHEIEIKALITWARDSKQPVRFNG